MVDTALLPHVGDVLESLTKASRWEEIGDSISDVVLSSYGTLESYYAMQLIGVVSTFLMLPPAGWLILDGATHEKDDYPELHGALPSQLKTATDFTLPDMTDVFLSGESVLANIGTGGGDSSYVLAEAQLPVHAHGYIPPVPSVTVGSVGPPVPNVAAGGSIPTTTTGAGEEIDNRPDFIRFSVAVYAGRVV